MKTETEQEEIISKFVESFTSRKIDIADVKPLYDLSEELPFEFTMRCWTASSCALDCDKDNEMIFSNMRIVVKLFGNKIKNYFKKPCCDSPKHCGVEGRVGNCLNCNKVYSDYYKA